jgi:hypothetical protein
MKVWIKNLFQECMNRWYKVILVSLLGLLLAVGILLLLPMIWDYSRWMVFLGVIFLLNTLLLFVSLSWIVLLRRQIRVLGQSACPHCGALYGMELAQQVRDSEQERRQELIKKQPGRRYDFDPFWEVPCPQCRQVSYFYPVELVLQPDRGSGRYSDAKSAAMEAESKARQKSKTV